LKLHSWGLLLPAALLLAGCFEPRTTEQPGADPRLEAEVERLREALAAGPLAAAGSGVGVALVDEGELRWVRSFGQGIDAAASYPVPQLAPLVLAVGLERLVDQGRLHLPDERRRELLAAPDEAALLAAEIEKAAGKPWREYLRKEIVGPLKMAKTSLPEGPEPALEASAEDLVHLMVDLQKVHAGRAWRRLEPAGAKRLLRPLAGDRGLGLEFGGQGQSAYFLRRGRAGGHSFLFVGFVSSGNGAVIVGPGDELVDAVRKVVADTYDWPDFKS
jgi:CubicO group peptidase (beta-lactamase class C family)